MKNIRKLILLISMVLLIGGINAYAATVGDTLEQPEIGWKRYDDRNSLIKYSGETTEYDGTAYYNDTQTYFDGANHNGKIEFKFVGTKLRIIESKFNNRSQNVSIKIDGNVETYSEFNSTVLYSQLVYEKTGLSEGEHIVEIYQSDSETFGLDAIDIDENGYLVAQVGSKLSEPEAGWKRYDNDDENIIYSNDWLDYSSASYHNGALKYTNVTGATINFKFYGTKLRLLGVLNDDRPSDIQVLVDGVPYIGNQHAASVIYKGLFFEISDLSLGNHTVQITTSSAETVSLDAIDIDENGYLVAQVGLKLTEPEAGWKRYNDSFSSIVYENFTNPRAPQIGAYEDDLSFSTSSDGIIKFKFRGTKLRLISQVSPNRATSHTITIDGIDETYTEKNEAQINKVLVYEKTGLTNAIHEVSIVGSYSISLDAIDVDIDGELLLWNTPSNLLTIPQNDSITLNWDIVPDTDSYTILRSTDSGTVDTVIASNIATTTYTDTNVTQGVTYYYVVRAVKNGVESADSNIASAMNEISNNRALLLIKLLDENDKEYDLYMSDVDTFMNWYFNRGVGQGPAYYTFTKDYNTGPYISRKDYISYDKIICIEVNEYAK